MATLSVECGSLPLLLLLLLPLLLPTLASAARASSGPENQRFQCPYLGITNCTANDGLAFSDGCKVIACIGWRSAVVDPRFCQPASGPSQLERCRRLSDRLERMQSSVIGGEDTLVNCPQFENVDLCATADPYFNYHDGCNFHLCDGSGGTIEKSSNTCPNAATSEHLFFCASNYNAAVRKHNSRHACSAMVNNAERICEVMWPGFKFGDACFGSNDFVCGPGGRLLLRPPARLCPLAEASESLKCREVESEVADLLSDNRGFTCPELQYVAICTEENRGFVYFDGCNTVLCDGESSGLTEGRVCKLPFDTTQTAGLEYCAGLTASLRRQIASSRRWTEPCVTPAEVCASPAMEGESYFNGCNFCTCLGLGQAQCGKRPCIGFYGTSDEFGAYCAKATYRMD